MPPIYSSGYFGAMKRHAPEDGAYLHDCAFVGVVVKRLPGGRALVEQRNRVREGDTLEALSPSRLGLAFVASHMADADGAPIREAAIPMSLFALDAPEDVQPGDMLRIRCP